MNFRVVGFTILTAFMIVLLPGRLAYPDIVWTKMFNYSGKIIEETPEYVIIKTDEGPKKIPREKIEDITYSAGKAVAPEEKAKIQNAQKSLEQAVRDQLEWQRKNPREYQKQLRKQDAERKKEEREIKKQMAEDNRRLRELERELKREEAEFKRQMRELEAIQATKANEQTGNDGQLKIGEGEQGKGPPPPRGYKPHLQELIE